MLRVLLVIDDYQELLFLQTLLKKTGFDVDGTQNPKKFDDFKLSLNPELIIATSKGKSVNGLKLAESIKKVNAKPFFILVVPNRMAGKVRGLKLNNVDAMIDSPIDAKKLLATIAKVASLDPDQLIEKYHRIVMQLDADNESDMQVLKSQADSFNEEKQVVSGDVSLSSSESVKNLSHPLEPSSIDDAERSIRMQKAIEALKDPSCDGFSRLAVEKYNKKIRIEERDLEIEDLEEERQAFVRTMFKNAKSIQ